MNHEAILALIAELYGSVSRLNQENAALREQLAAATNPPEPSPTEAGT